MQIRTNPDSAIAEYICWLLNMPQTLLHQAFAGNVDLESGIGQGEVVEYDVQASVVSSELMGSYVQLQMKY